MFYCLSSDSDLDPEICDDVARLHISTADNPIVNANVTSQRNSPTELSTNPPEYYTIKSEVKQPTLLPPFEKKSDVEVLQNSASTDITNPGLFTMYTTYIIFAIYITYIYYIHMSCE